MLSSLRCSNFKFSHFLYLILLVNAEVKTFVWCTILPIPLIKSKVIVLGQGKKDITRHNDIRRPRASHTCSHATRHQMCFINVSTLLKQKQNKINEPPLPGDCEFGGVGSHNTFAAVSHITVMVESVTVGAYCSAVGRTYCEGQMISINTQ